MYILKIVFKSSLNEELFYKDFKHFLEKRSQNFFYFDSELFEFERVRDSSLSYNYVFKYKVTALSSIDYYNQNWYNNVIIFKCFD